MAQLLLQATSIVPARYVIAQGGVCRKHKYSTSNVVKKRSPLSSRRTTGLLLLRVVCSSWSVSTCVFLVHLFLATIQRGEPNVSSKLGVVPIGRPINNFLENLKPVPGGEDLLVFRAESFGGIIFTTTVYFNQEKKRKEKNNAYEVQQPM